MNYETDLIKFPIEFQNEFKKALTIVRSKPDESIEILERLVEYPEVNTYPLIHAQLEYMIGDAYYQKSNSDALKHLLVSYETFIELEEWEMAVHVQSFIGLTYMAQGLFASAMSSFAKEVTISQKHNMDVAFFKANMQLGQCFYAIKDYESAYTYYLAADVAIGAHPEIAKQTESIPILYSCFVLTLSAMKEFDQAQTYFLKMNDSFSSYPRLMNSSYHIIPKIILKLRLQEERDSEYVTEVINQLMQADDISGNTILIDNELLKFLTENEYYEQALVYANYLEKNIEHTNYYRIQQTVYKCKALIYHALGRSEEAYQEHLKYVDISDRLRTLSVKSSLYFFDIQKELDEAFNENEFLKIASDTDYLTKLPNRRALENQFNHVYQDTQEKNEKICFIMLDLDNFKNVNDTLGHHIGDLCLVLLGDILQKYQSENCFCARYGGDEFSIILRNDNCNQKDDIMNNIKSEYEKLSMIHFDKKITLSYGLFEAIPSSQNSIEDYMTKADELLYQSKNRLRGN